MKFNVIQNMIKRHHLKALEMMATEKISSEEYFKYFFHISCSFCDEVRFHESVSTISIKIDEVCTKYIRYCRDNISCIEKANQIKQD